MKSLALSLLAILSLSACSMPIEMRDSNLKPGQYHISRIDVVANDDPMAGYVEMQGTVATAYKVDQKDFASFKPILESSLQQQLQGKGTGQEVKLTVKVNAVQIVPADANKVAMFFVGGKKNLISSKTILTDLKTGKVIGESKYDNTTESVPFDGLGAVQLAVRGQATEVQSLADRHAAKIKDELYPAK